MTRLRASHRLLAAALAAGAALLVIPEMHAAASGAAHHGARLAPVPPDWPHLAGSASGDASDGPDRCPLCFARGQARSALAQTPGVRSGSQRGSAAALPPRADARLPGEIALWGASPRAPPTRS